MTKILISAIAALLLCVGWLWWQLDSKTERVGNLESDLAQEQAITKSLIDAASIQASVTAVAETESQQGAQDVEQIRTDIAADDTAERLRVELAQVRRSATHTAANAATQRLADSQTIGVLTHMLESCSGFAGVVAGAYEEARARGLTCQRVYEGVRAKVND
ncbi:MAG: DUF2514 family protein [Pseudomonas sp.]|nr:DUF2514 family protein [Pseudomonas sp.]